MSFSAGRRLLAFCLVGYPGSCAAPLREEAAPALESRGAFVERQSAPDATPVGNVSDPILTLRTPYSRAQAVDVLDRYFAAIARESNTELAELPTEDATMQYGPQTSAGLALVAWVRRFAQRDYVGVHAASIYDAEGPDLRSARDLAERAHLAGVAFVPEGAELSLRVPLSANAGKNRFGQELQLLLVPSERGLLIRKIMETGYAEP
jgi:hypothetical protein